MASFKHTFTSGQTVTPARLNNARDVFDIVNADIKSNAAIVGTKVAPNFGSQGVETTGNVTAARLVAAAGTDALPSITFTGDGDTGIFRPGANVIAFAVNGTEKARINTNGIVTPNNVTAEKLVAAAGTDALPSITFTGDGNTGIFHPAADTIAFCEGGVEVMRINSSSNIGIGTSSPSVKFDVNGIVNTASQYRVAGLKVVGDRRLGWETPTGTNKRTTYSTATVTLEELAQVVKALIIDLEAHGLIGPTPP